MYLDPSPNLVKRRAIRAWLKYFNVSPTLRDVLALHIHEVADNLIDEVGEACPDLPAMVVGEAIEELQRDGVTLRARELPALEAAVDGVLTRVFGCDY